VKHLTELLGKHDVVIQELTVKYGHSIVEELRECLKNSHLLEIDSILSQAEIKRIPLGLKPEEFRGVECHRPLTFLISRLQSKDFIEFMSHLVPRGFRVKQALTQVPLAETGANNSADLLTGILSECL